MEKMSGNTNALNWFDIPVTDVARAKTFYETIFGIEMFTANMQGAEMVFFPDTSASGKVSGALVKSESRKPSPEGVTIYLNANPVLQDVLNRVEAAGGKVLLHRTVITEEIGVMAFFLDTEGNRLGLHANK